MFTFYVFFFDFHDGGVGEGSLLPWLEFFLFVDALLILSRHHTIGDKTNGKHER